MKGDTIRSIRDLFASLFGKVGKAGGEVRGQDVSQPQPRKQEASPRAQVRGGQAGELFQPGDIIGGKYEVHRQLGKGGFGIVYLAYDRQTKEVVALKTFRDEFLADGEAQETFKKEALLWVNLDLHPFILPARLVEEFSGRLFVAMDCIAPDERGCVSLQDHLARARGPLDGERALRWAIQFCYGMEHANAHGMRCHGDIKPANILVTQDATVQVTDFGLAAAEMMWKGKGSVVSIAGEGRLGYSLLCTEGRRVRGTPGYIAPELYEEQRADVRSDVYSFGAVLWQMAAGSPFSPFHAQEVRYRGDDEEYLAEYNEKVYQKQRSGHVPRVDGDLGSVVGKCLKLDPGERYRDFRLLREEVEGRYRRQTGRTVSVPAVGEKTAAFWNNKGVSLRSLGRYQEAIACYDKALEIDPQLAATWNNKGGSLNSLGRYQEAVDCYDKALETDPRYANAWNSKGNSLDRLGRYQEAIACYDKALEVDLQLAATWSNKGRSLNSLGRFQEAISCLDEALKIDPRFANAWTNKGLSLHHLGRYQEAIGCYEKALEVDPRDAPAWSNKGASLSSLGRYQEAVNCFDEALKIDPRDAAAWYNKGNTLRDLGRYQEAVNCFDEALKIDPRDAAAWYGKAIAEEEGGREADAVDSYRQFIRHAPREYAGQVTRARQWLRELGSQ